MRQRCPSGSKPGEAMRPAEVIVVHQLRATCAIHAPSGLFETPAKGKPLGRKLLADVASLATPETILRWYREQVAAKCDGSRTRGGPGGPAARGDKVQHLLTMAANSPNLNAYAERFVRSVKQECLRHIIPLGERHLHAVLRDFVEHYHAERNHQGLGNQLIRPVVAQTRGGGRIVSRERLGGLLKYYHRPAA